MNFSHVVELLLIRNYGFVYFSLFLDDYCSPAYEYTDGFMSLDRIDAVLDKYMNGSFDYSLNGFQAIFPGVTFTCNGSIQSWIFGARMEGTATSSLQRRLATINYARAT